MNRWQTLGMACGHERPLEEPFQTHIWQRLQALKELHKSVRGLLEYTGSLPTQSNKEWESRHVIAVVDKQKVVQAIGLFDSAISWIVHLIPAFWNMFEELAALAPYRSLVAREAASAIPLYYAARQRANALSDDANRSAEEAVMSLESATWCPSLRFSEPEKTTQFGTLVRLIPGQSEVRLQLVLSEGPTKV